MYPVTSRLLNADNDVYTHKVSQNVVLIALTVNSIGSVHSGTFSKTITIVINMSVIFAKQMSNGSVRSTYHSKTNVTWNNILKITPIRICNCYCQLKNIQYLKHLLKL